MFEITTAQDIRMHAGDCADFNVLLNMGDNKTLIRHKVGLELAQIINTPKDLKVELDSKIFISKVEKGGFYSLLFNENNRWELNRKTINPYEYGITITGTPSLWDSISIYYRKAIGCELEFYLQHYNEPLKFILKKVYKDNGDILTYKFNEEIPEVSHDNITVSKEGDFIVSFVEDDTKYIPNGEYLWHCRAKLTKPNIILNDDGEVNEDDFEISTITSRHSLFLINDNIDRYW